MLEEYDGNLAEINAELQKEYLKIKLVKTRTKKGYNFTKVIIVGTVPAPAEYVDENGLTVDSDTGEVVYGENAPF